MHIENAFITQKWAEYRQRSEAQKRWAEQRLALLSEVISVKTSGVKIGEAFYIAGDSHNVRRPISETGITEPERKQESAGFHKKTGCPFLSPVTKAEPAVLNALRKHGNIYCTTGGEMLQARLPRAFVRFRKWLTTRAGRFPVHELCAAD